MRCLSMLKKVCWKISVKVLECEAEEESPVFDGCGLSCIQILKEERSLNVVVWPASAVKRVVCVPFPCISVHI